VRYLVTGGGTGGHIYPAIAICKGIGIRDEGAEILYVGTKTGLEATFVPREGIPFETIDSAGIMGRSPAMAARGAARAARGTFQALSIMGSFRPDVVLGTGGYVSGPVVLTARIKGIPCAIQEQNAVPGFTNRLLGRMVDEIYTPFPGTEAHFPVQGKCIFTGNPVRPEIAHGVRERGVRALELDPERRTLLVFGGSRGARRIVEAAIQLLVTAALPEDVQMLLVTGDEYYVMAQQALAGAGVPVGPGAKVVLRPYLHNMPDAYAAGDLLIGRAGGMTVSEVLLAGLPSILVPSPNVANNHQLYNARAGSASGAALVILEEDLTPERLAGAVNSIFGDEAVRAEMARSARAAGKPDATSDIVNHLLGLARRN
jgi:UDP-N-acetylglucosamine--N-acetylmuramyl-(pentapeptide) pyrophosphoryl-undecaprenol N-acetylglucosamine transferase